MTTQQHYDAPGSPAWLARRARSFNAGDAPAMLACTPNKTRSALLQELHTGIAPEFSDYVQKRVIDPGHRVEDLCRPIGAEIIGEALTVMGCSLTIEGLSRPLGASLDGITFVEDVTWECKSLNAEIRAALPHQGRDSADKNDAAALPKMYRVQMEQQLAASGAMRSLFSAAAFDGQGNVTEERHAWYSSDPALRAEIIAGWKQFDADLATFVPSAPAASVAVAAPMESLPAVSVQLQGSLVVASNLPQFDAALRAFIDRIPAKATTDQEFADTEAACKALKKAEEALDAADEHSLASLSDVAAARKLMQDLRNLARTTRLAKEKDVAARKEQIRHEIYQEGTTAFQQHMAALNTRLGKPYMPGIPGIDFAGAMKGKKTVASLRDAVSTELARAKIAANEVADRIDANLKTLRERATAHAFLFADTPQLVLKQPDDLAAIVTARIGEHEAKEAARLAAERERIAAEEKAKAEAAAAAEAKRLADEAAEQARAEERKRIADEQAAQAELQAKLRSPDAAVRRAAQKKMLHPNGAPMYGDSIKENGDHIMLDADGKRSVFCDLNDDMEPAPAPAVVRLPMRAAPATPAPLSAPTLKLGEIAKRLGFVLSAEFLKSLGFEPAGKVGAHGVYHEAQFPLICAALVAHIEAVHAQQAA